MSVILEQPALILNRNWQPVGVSTVARSLTLLWNSSAQVIDPQDFSLYTWDDWADLTPPEGEPFIQAVSRRLRVPEVLTLMHYDRVPTRTVAFSRINLFKRDRYMCQYCGVQPGSEELTIDHIIPRSQSGISSWENCVLACIRCNTRKADRTPEQAHMPLRKRPERPAWRPLYATRKLRLESWTKFLSEAYWNVELQE